MNDKETDMKTNNLTTMSSSRSDDSGTTYCRRHGGRVVLLLSIFALSAVDLMAQGDESMAASD